MGNFKLRIQSSYASKSYEDRSNKVVIKKIWGTAEGYEQGVKTEDTDEIKELCVNSENLPVQEDILNGFIFPKDREYVHAGETSQVYNNENGMFVHFENEIKMRNKSNKYQKFTIDLPMEGDDVVGPKQIDLNILKSINFEIQNFSYVSELNVAIKNDYGGTAYATLKMPTRMAEPKMFSVNLSKETTMAHTLTSIEFEIIASGVDNLILLNKITFDEAKPADINGIDLDDKYCYGFNGENVDVTYSLSSSSTQFDVKEDGAFVTSSKNNIKLTNRGYYKLTLAYSRTASSQVNKVFVSFKTGENYSPEVEFEIDMTQTAISSISNNFDLASTGDFTNIKIRFAGTGIIKIRSIRFDVDNNYSLKLSNDFSNAYDSTWVNGLTYSYDENKEASLLSVNQAAASKSNNISFYLSVGHNNFPGAYNCANLNLEEKTKFVVVYRAENNNATGKVILGFSHTENDNPDETGTSREFAVTFEKSNLEYEWKYLEIDIPSDFAGWYLGKISFRDVSSSVSLRLASVI